MALDDPQRKSRGRGRLPPPTERAPLPAVNAAAYPRAAEPVAGSDGEGVASPLIENELLREYWPETNITSSDGLFVIVYQPYKARVFIDALGRAIRMEYPQP